MFETFIKGRKWVLTVLITTVIVVFLIMGIFYGCAGEEAASTKQATEEGTAGEPFEGEELVLTGSTTLLQASEAWASAFMEKYGGTVIVNGGGSGEGIAALINGTTDLANASRQIEEEEIETAKANGLNVQEHLVLYDGIAVIVSSNVGVDELTIEQLSKIYTGEITNWKDIGGQDAEIVAVARDSSSGTGEYFLEEIVQLGKTKKENDYSPECLRLQSNADIVNVINTTENAIGYIGLGYLEESLKVVKIEGVSPSVETVKDATYPISRGLYIYTPVPTEELSEIARVYLEFVMSEEGQEIGLQEGFVPVK